MSSLEPQPRINPLTHGNSSDWCCRCHQVPERAWQSWGVTLRLSLLVLVSAVAEAVARRRRED
jgi:hypothetical protein